MAWTGEVPPQKWMKFYTAILSKFAATKALTTKLTVEVSPGSCPGTISWHQPPWLNSPAC